MSTKRGPYSSPRQQERRLRVLREAGALLERQGLAALTLQGIADASGVSLRTLYNQFGSLDRLLLDAADQVLVDLLESAPVLDAEEGIPRLLAFTSGTMHQFENMPEYSRAVISILVRAELDPESAYERFGPVQRFALASLRIAARRGELKDGADPLELSYLISANEWGAVLMWEKRLLQVEQLERQIHLNNCLTLLPACRGARRRALEATVEELISQPTSTRHDEAS